MASTQTEGLSSDRVQGFSKIDLDDICCPICHNILWKPIACQSCETHFCTMCIDPWLENNPGKCPMRCSPYIERACSRFIIKQLAKLKIDCIHQSNGCEEVISYEALEKHEEECIYQTKECSGCHLFMSKKNLIEHESQCPMIEWTCPDCNLTVKKSDVTEYHTDLICLQEQLKNLRQSSQEKNCELKKNIHEYKIVERILRTACAEHTRKLNAYRKMIMKTTMTITFNDISADLKTDGAYLMSSSYGGFLWAGFSYMHIDHAKSTYPGTGYATAFTSDRSRYIVWSSCPSSIRTEHRNETFDVISLDACAVYSDLVNLIIRAHRNSTKIYEVTSTLLLGKPQPIELCWTDIDTLSFEPNASVRQSGRTNAPHFALTCLTVSSSRH